MLKSAEKISKSPVKQAVIEALQKHTGFSLVLCGHSLGGGVAALLTLIWSREVTTEDGKKAFVTDISEGLPLRSIRCFVYVRLSEWSHVLGTHSPYVCSTFKGCQRADNMLCI